MTILSKKKSGSTKEGESTDGLTAGHPAPPPHPQIHIQPESSSGEAWPGLVPPREPTNQSHLGEHIESQANTKRRHRLVSPLRSPRIKHGRVERERSPTASPLSATPPVPLTPPAEDPGTASALPDESIADVNGCNSEDEYECRPHAQLTEDEWVEKERRFEKKIRKKGLSIKLMGEDGACLFRAVADQVYGDQEMHNVVRRHCMDYIAANSDYFSQYVTEDFQQYVSRKRLDNVHGNHVEIQAMSEMYNRAIEVFCYSTEPINTFHGNQQTDNEPIRLSYHRGVHYNSILDPYKATVGVGLGLPGHHPGLADKNILKEATRQSEDVQIEQAMLEDKLRVTDWEATNEAIEEQVARESYLQWLKDNERRNRNSWSPAAASSSATATCSSASEIRSPKHRSQGSMSPMSSPFRGDTTYNKNSPSRLSPPLSIPDTPVDDMNADLNVDLTKSGGIPASSGSTASNSNFTQSTTTDNAFQILETQSFMNQLPPQMFGLNEWDDSGLLAQVLAVSQQEYLDNLKKSCDPSDVSTTGDDSTRSSEAAHSGSTESHPFVEEN